MASNITTLEGSVLTPAKVSARKHAIGLTLLISVVVAIGVSIAIRYASRIQDLRLMPSLAVASFVILVGMAGIYIQKYQFNHDLFYALLALGWIANGIYIFLEGFYVPREGDLQFSLAVYSFAQITFIAFFLASFAHQDQEFPRKRVLAELTGWFALIFGNLLLVWHSMPTSAAIQKSFSKAAVAGIAFSTWTLIRTGSALKSRLPQDTYGKWSWIFPSTFYAFAALQPVYLLRLEPNQHFVEMAFCVALAIKVLNGISVVSIVQRDIGAVRERLERVSILEDLGVLTASIEHDIRNPLGVIETEMDGMKEKFQARPEIVRHLDKIEDQVDRISATTEIIETLRGGKAYYERFMTKTSIGDLLSRSIKAVKDELKPSNIIFTKPVGPPAFTKAYQPLLQQVFVNILKNAVEAIHTAKRETGLITLSVGPALARPNMVEIKIWDNGCGISDADLPKLGKLFSTKQKPNSGIGLFISRRILTFHQGHLNLESTTGEGTTVSVFLPIWKDRE